MIQASVSEGSGTAAKPPGVVVSPAAATAPPKTTSAHLELGMAAGSMTGPQIFEENIKVTEQRPQWGFDKMTLKESSAFHRKSDDEADLERNSKNFTVQNIIVLFGYLVT